MSLKVIEKWRDSIRHNITSYWWPVGTMSLSCTISETNIFSQCTGACLLVILRVEITGHVRFPIHV